MTPDMQALYQDLIIEHNRYPRNFGQIENPTHRAHGYNPLCGDEVHITLVVQEETIEDVKFQGRSCAICRASASIMTTVIKGKSIPEVENIWTAFHQILTSEDIANHTSLPPGIREKLQIFSTVKNFPMRVKCASLPWHTLSAALSGQDAQITTE